MSREKENPEYITCPCCKRTIIVKDNQIIGYIKYEPPNENHRKNIIKNS